jgi:hypothetical protein
LNAPSLNGRKFLSLRVSQGDLRSIALDYIGIATAYKFEPKFIHSIFFIAGSNLRQMEVALNAMKGSISELLEITRSPALWDPRADRTRTQHGPLILALNNALVKKNEKIICQVYEDPKLVFTIEWLNVMRPLTSSEIKEIVNKLGVRLESVNSLIDRGFFSGPSDLDSLFAAAPIHLLHHYPMYRINRWFGIRKVFDKVNTEDMKDLIQRIVQMVVAEVAKSAFNTIVK